MKYLNNMIKKRIIHKLLKFRKGSIARKKTLSYFMVYFPYL